MSTPPLSQSSGPRWDSPVPASLGSAPWSCHSAVRGVPRAGRLLLSHTELGPSGLSQGQRERARAPESPEYASERASGSASRAVWVSFPVQAPNLGGDGGIWPGLRPWSFRPERAAHGALGKRRGGGDPGQTGLSEAGSEVAFTMSLLSSMHLPDPGSASRGTVVSGSGL